MTKFSQQSWTRSRSTQSKRSSLAALLCAFSLALAPQIHAQSNPDSSIFRGTPESVKPGKYGTMKIRGKGNARAIREGRETFELDLPDGRKVSLEKTAFKTKKAGRVTWRGRAKGYKNSEVTLSARGDHVAGRVLIESDVYEVKPVGGGEIEIEWIDQSTFPKCETQPLSANQQDSKQDALLAPETSLINATNAGDGFPEITILVLYDALALSEVGNDTVAMETMVDAAVETINTAFTNSQVAGTATLAHTQLVTHTETSGSNLLNWLEADSGVAALRNTYGADLVAIITHFDPFCGLGNLPRVAGPYMSPSSGFQATDTDCAIGNLTFVHETGHNMGMEHNADLPGGSASVFNGYADTVPSYPDSFGHWVDTATNDYRSIMSYNTPCGTCIQLAQFSNPSLNFAPGGVDSGLASGTVGPGDGSNNGHNNALTGNLTVPWIADYRSAAPTSGLAAFKGGEGDDDSQENLLTGVAANNYTEVVFHRQPGTSSDPSTMAFRFPDVTIPKGAYINSASLAFTSSSNNYSDTLIAEISVEDSDNPSAYTDGAINDITSRPLGSSVPWTTSEAWTTGQSYASPDISALVQETVDRAGWIPYQAMAFEINRTAGGRKAWSFNRSISVGHTNDVPSLFIEWSSCSGTRTLPGANAWSMITIPCDTSAATVADLFSDLNQADYASTWAILSHNTTTDVYSIVDYNTALESGQGYWYTNLGSDYSWAMRGVEVGGIDAIENDITLQGDSSGVYNMVGHTSAQNVPWSNVRVLYSGSELTLDEVNPGNICDTSPADATCVMSRAMSKYISGAYSAFNGTTPGLEGTLVPMDGFWVKVFKPGVQLRIPAAATSLGSDELPSSKGNAKKTSKGDDWFMRLAVESNGQTDRGNVLGQQPDAQDELDRHDLKERTPQASSWLSLTFLNDHLPAADWGYTSDFRAPTKKPKGEWAFVVKGSDDKNEVTLTWSGDNTAISRASLIDESTGKRTKLKKLESYTFTLEDGEKILKLVIR